MVGEEDSFVRRHWEGYKEFWGERFSFLENYSRFIKRDKPLPSWSEADVEEFIASDPLHGPTGVSDSHGASNSSSGSQGFLDMMNPMYIHPSESAGSALIPVKFDGTGYRSWRRGILRALSVKNKLGFIDGKCKKPDPNSDSCAMWERCDDMVTSWMLNSLSPELMDSLQYVNNAKELWDELEERYDQTNGAKLYQLQRDINEFVQGNLDITAYYTKLRKLWEELSALDLNMHCTCLCVCGGKAALQKTEQDRRLIQFLMGLNEVYTVVRGNILMMNPLPSMAQAFAILTQEEKQRAVKPQGSRLGFESTSLNVGRFGDTHSGTNYRQYSQLKHTSGSSAGGSGQSFNKSGFFCEHCKKSGHTKDKCYRLHGFPPNFRFTKGRNAGGSASHVHGNCVTDSQAGSTQTSPNLSKDQYEHLVSLLTRMQHGQPEDSVHNNACGAVNLAGPFNEEATGDW